ncbi:aminotransferase [Collibacillus ludicampi]|uniref:Aminotransferase n=1 Tax=Collibacillus ludicampi TaxID=2771369 RepID=A0AAV4LH83_9BACL|nr:LL-diaminopimelate aminotransferase [Collibacillus ludicampi]GIM47159.1 aminotransferase [Collibacillus ludicampi]
MKVSQRLSHFSSAVFFELNSVRQKLQAQGIEIIDLGIGSPDLPPPDHVREALIQAAGNPAAYGYPTSEGTFAFRQAVADWYDRRFGVSLDPQTEVHALMGSQDGLAHLALALIDPGDYVLVPDPGYPIYAVSIHLAGGKLYPMPLRAENGFLPDFDAIPRDVAAKAKLMILNYPNNPVTATADAAFYELAVAFAKRHEILIAHDAAYSELSFDGYSPISFLEVPGAKEIGVEFHSTSKSFNLAGCRIGFVVGRADIIEALHVVKSNIDYGVFLPIQEAAITALKDDRGHTQRMASIYQKRRDILLDGLQEAGWTIPKPQATMFVWAPIPNGIPSRTFAKELLLRTGVVVVPGVGFGAEGEGYVRMALVQNEEKLKEVAQRLKESNLFG